MKTPPRLLGTLLAAALLAACGSDDDPAPAPAWQWVDVPGMICADGTPTGIGVSEGPSDAVMVFLMGGGACWGEDDYACAAEYGPFEREDFDGLVPFATVAPTIFNRGLAGNPFAGWTQVFVPYCTGDVHAGDTVVDHRGVTWRHHGRANLDAALAVAADIVPSAARVAVTGSSAGGFGALLAFDRAKAAWPDARAYLVDDSGPLLAAIPDDTRLAWIDAWDLGPVLADVCGTACASSLAPALPTLAAANPASRFALLSTTEDLIIRGFFSDPATSVPMSAEAFEASLLELASALEDAGNAHAFLVAGDAATDHALFFSPADYVAGSTPLLGWLSQMVEDDAAWTSAGP